METILKRLSEPSTGAGIAVIASFFVPQLAPIIPDFVASLAQTIGLGAAGWAIFAKEKTS